MLLKRGEGDAMICGSAGRFDRHLKHVGDIIGRREGAGVHPCSTDCQFRVLFGDALERCYLWATAITLTCSQQVVQAILH